jgi:hypothetical protein
MNSGTCVTPGGRARDFGGVFGFLPHDGSDIEHAGVVARIPDHVPLSVQSPCPWCGRLTPPATRVLLWVERRLTLGRRFYVAHDLTKATIRHKDDAGLAEWRSRAWRMFTPPEPHIIDVTESYAKALIERADWPAERRAATGIGFDRTSRRATNYEPGGGEGFILDLTWGLQGDMPEEALPVWTPL